MRLQILGCCGGSVPGRLPTSFLIDGTVAVDAGALTSALTPDAQERVNHVVLSHAHLDHCANLPFLLDNRFARQQGPITVYGGEATIRDLSDGIFNNRVWPDFTILKTRESVSLTFQVVEPGRPFDVNGLTFTAIEMQHTVPCHGYLIEDGEARLFIAGDTGSAEAVRDAVSGIERLDAIIIEVSWPDRLAELSQISGHLHPGLLAESWPLHPTARVLISHIKPLHLVEVTAELAALAKPNLVVLDDGMEFDF